MKSHRPRESNLNFDKFMEEGIRSYFNAAISISTFEHEVQGLCRQVLVDYLPDYNQALNVRPSLKEDQIHVGVWPKKDSIFEDWRSIGAEIYKYGVVRDVSWWGFSLGLSWESKGDGNVSCECWLGEWFSSKSWAQLHSQLFKRNDANVKEDGDHDICLFASMRPEEFGSIDEKLRELFDRWIACWKKIGGMKAFVSKME